MLTLTHPGSSNKIIMDTTLRPFAEKTGTRTGHQLSHALESGQKRLRGAVASCHFAVRSAPDAFTGYVQRGPARISSRGTRGAVSHAEGLHRIYGKGFSSQLQIRNWQMRQSESVFSHVGLPGVCNNQLLTGEWAVCTMQGLSSCSFWGSTSAPHRTPLADSPSRVASAPCLGTAFITPARRGEDSREWV